MADTADGGESRTGDPGRDEERDVPETPSPPRTEPPSTGGPGHAAARREETGTAPGASAGDQPAPEARTAPGSAEHATDGTGAGDGAGTGEVTDDGDGGSGGAHPDPPADGSRGGPPADGPRPDSEPPPSGDAPNTPRAPGASDAPGATAPSTPEHTTSPEPHQPTGTGEPPAAAGPSEPPASPGTPEHPNLPASPGTSPAPATPGTPVESASTDASGNPTASGSPERPGEPEERGRTGRTPEPAERDTTDPAKPRTERTEGADSGTPRTPTRTGDGDTARRADDASSDAPPPEHRPGPDQPAPRTGDPDRPQPSGGSGEPGPPAGDQGPAPDSGSPPPPKAAPRQRPKGGGILMGRPFGVPVYVAPSWFLVAALITWVFGGQLDRVLPDLGGARYLIALFFAVAFYASVLVHELAHTVAALRFGLPVRRIQLQFFGGVSEIEKESETPGREFVLAFVGPLLSLVLAGVFYGAMQLVEPRTVPGVLLAGLMISNLIVAVFNLLPGLPLDGGRMLRAVVWKLSGKPMTGTVAAAWTGRALAIAVLVGLPLATHAGERGDGVSGMNSLTDALLAAILAAIIWTGAGNSLRMARLREHLPDLRARTLTRRAVPVESDTPLSEALRRANESGARALVVVDGRGAPISLVREAAIVGVPEHRRPWVAVSTLAQDLREGMRVPAELAGEELLDHLRATPATEYLVVEETGEIYGVLATGDVERAFVQAMAKPS
ncbi:site-2 protease family protein [Streptomyces sp. AJS327]|uniref:site-2 protease family protein n=1 Tax=Streptomyces sp. AJS327 TaxID=2545265 RepID=UPI0027E59DAA|nr:site-2 protease family protein [Streptomyces sp. AJS327]